MAHTASTVQRLLEDGSIKASSVAPNEMYQCHYLAHGTCFCKSPFVPGAGSSGGNRDWNSYIVAGQTPPSGLDPEAPIMYLLSLSARVLSFMPGVIVYGHMLFTPENRS